ncbi:MAG: hypothetical protein AABZ06_08710 [Bdellovibrionota bacterium]
MSENLIYVKRRNESRWYRNEIEQLIWLGFTGKFSASELSVANNVSLDQYIFGARNTQQEEESELLGTHIDVSMIFMLE